ncbi:MAG: TIGR03643 family protein [Pirellula sp.]
MLRINENKNMPLTPADIDRIIQMAWEDRTSFDVIQTQFGLTPGEVIKLMRSEMKPSSFRLWRARTTGRKTKHVALRDFEVGRFRCPDQKGS